MNKRRKKVRNMAKLWIGEVIRDRRLPEESIRWKGFSRAKTRIGRCSGFGIKVDGRYIERHAEITVSGFYADKDVPIGFMEKTILHELAHAIDWVEGGRLDHGRHWKSLMEDYFGIPADVTCNTEDRAILEKYQRQVAKYIFDCPGCSTESLFFRKPKYARRICKNCGAKASVKPL